MSFQGQGQQFKAVTYPAQGPQVVRMHANLDAARAAGDLASCPVSVAPTTVMVGQTVLVKHQQLVEWYSHEFNHQPVTTAPSMKVVRHPAICQPMPQADCAPAVAAPVCATGCGAAGAPFGAPSTVLPGGNVSTTRFW